MYLLCSMYDSWIDDDFLQNQLSYSELAVAVGPKQTNFRFLVKIFELTRDRLLV